MSALPLVASVRSSPPTIEHVRSLLPVLDSLPLPGRGRTIERWRELATLARNDLSVARLAEGHADALAVLSELGRGDLATPGQLWGVWAADPGRLRAEPAAHGWRLDGVKGWCSGSQHLDRALVTATAPDGPRLFAVTPDPTWVVAGSWQPLGMVETVSETLRLDRVPVPAGNVVGDPAAYVERAGFGHGGCGVAACWWGGARAVIDALHRSIASGDDHVAAALGHATTALTSSAATLRWAAEVIDDHPLDRAVADRTASIVRLAVERAARTTLDETVAALGARGLCHEPEHSARVADLTVYLSQLSRGRTAVAAGHALADVLDLELEL